MGLSLSRWAKRTTKRTKNFLRKRRAKKMLALQPGMDRLSLELSAQRDRLVRLQSVQTDIALDLPPSIPLPDGEEIPYGSSTRLQIRDPEQESEIYQKCIRPPPNRTVFDGESLPSYRSSSAGLLSSDWSSGSSSGSLVVRCHSVSGASSKRPANILGRTVRCLSGKRCHHSGSEDSSMSSIPSSRSSSKSASVVVPSHRCRRLLAFSDSAAASSSSSLASLSTVQCVTPSSSCGSSSGSDGGRSQVPSSSQISRPCLDERSRSHPIGETCENRTNDNKSKSKCDRSTV
ncbi:hypothetical protein RUM44_004713 [Polyplax serrata]|uniref:Uncharacterized protein n=1 Tax=Polyplax serrata TaxID=468196 RepID=A0ABR1B3L0_POLSC